jgi:XrtN system VIT domain protein
MPQSKLSEKFLKTELVYSTAPDVEDWGFFRMPSRNFDEVKKHDPITMLTTFILDKPNLTEDSKINILQAMYDSRHKAQERLWSGTDLTTGHILTNIRLYPSLRLSYTEKFITIHSNLSPKMWRPEQEAIYTFHLPEGSVVTSLSLWINGKEEKSILTSKNKADTAYKTIVGIERHDPSLVRWQEGNTVSVRVFPCTPNEDRRFKIGITTPLRAENNKLAYENIWFDGPDASSATENCKVHTMESLKTINLPQNFNEDAINTWVYEGNYIADHRIEIPILPISNNAFTFDGNTYRISNCEKTFENFDLQNIYLDINKQWTQDELLRILEIAKNKTIYVFQNQLLKIDDSNANKLFEQLTKYNFSVFPIYEIKDPDRSILISKGTLSSPNVSDLGDCDFANKLTEYVLSNKKIRLFNLNRELSPYLKTLKELRVFTYDYGDISYLNPLISGNKFIKNQENSHTIVLNDAGIKITESPDTIPSNAPDHLMRLFSYNNVMYSTGVNYFKKDFYNEDIVNKAYKAYVVSPVTSLIVLETKQDYERFGIKDEGSSLKNASMKSSGAVPEPHEWLLILLLASIAGYLYFHKKKNTIINQI